MTDLRNRFHWHNDGKFSIETYQDVRPYLERNKRRVNDFQRMQKVTDMRMTADIPEWIVILWKQKLGIDVFNKDHERAWKKLLNDPEWSWLKCVPGKV